MRRLREPSGLADSTEDHPISDGASLLAGNLVTISLSILCLLQCLLFEGLNSLASVTPRAHVAFLLSPACATWQP